MTKEYLPTSRFVHGWVGNYFVVGAVLIYAGWQDRLAWSTIAFMVSLMAFALTAVHWFFTTRGPWLRINHLRIETKRLTTGWAVVEDVRDYSLVISTDWIAFRRKGQQDVMINEGTFDPAVWKDLLTDLNGLPFKAIL